MPSVVTGVRCSGVSSTLATKPASASRSTFSTSLGDRRRVSAKRLPSRWLSVSSSPGCSRSSALLSPCIARRLARSVSDSCRRRKIWSSVSLRRTTTSIWFSPASAASTAAVSGAVTASACGRHWGWITLNAAVASAREVSTRDADSMPAHATSPTQASCTARTRAAGDILGRRDAIDWRFKGISVPNQAIRRTVKLTDARPTGQRHRRRGAPDLRRAPPKRYPPAP